MALFYLWGIFRLRRIASGLLQYLSTASRYTVLLAVLCRYLYSDSNDAWKCNSMLQHGRWSHNIDLLNTHHKWNPDSCVLHDYNSIDLRSCLHHQVLHFRGDSTVRQIFWATAFMLDSMKAQAALNSSERHADIDFLSKDETILFSWDPYLNRSDIFEHAQILGAGLWHARYLSQPNTHQQEANDILRNLAHVVESQTVWNVSGSQVSIMPITRPVFERLNDARRATITEDLIRNMNQELANFETFMPVKVLWSLGQMTDGHSELYQEDGIHIVPEAASIQANIFLNKICNSFLTGLKYSLHATCCIEPQLEGLQAFWLFVVLLLWLLQTVHHVSLIWADDKARNMSKTSPAPTLPETLRAAGTLSFALLYCYLADRTVIYAKTPKIIDTPGFLVLLGFCFLLGLCTIRKVSQGSTPNDNFLSRAQTDEWKGWMQFTILLYHYFGMSKVLWVYQIVRVLVGGYLFLTGYGHSLYLIKTNDFSIRRMISVLFRLNMLSLALSLIMHVAWSQYYFPLLSTCWYIITHLSVLSLKKVEPSAKTLIRFSGWVCIVVTVYLTGVNTGIHRLAYPMVARSDSKIAAALYEFRFRVSLDRYAPWTGILVAIIRHKFPTSQYGLARSKWINIAAGIIATASLGLYFWSIQRFSNKQDYNQWHPVISIIPILAYITVRNCCRTFRMYHSTLFAWLGRCSLETFVLQYHVWLAVDTKGLLHLSLIDRPGVSGNVAIMSWASWRYWMEKAVITAMFLWLSNAVAHASSVLTLAMTGRKK